MKLHIKNMVCPRCKMVVETQLKELGFPPLLVSLGEAVFEAPLDSEDIKHIQIRLNQYGFELLDDKRAQWISKIKSILILLIHKEDGHLTEPLSEYLSRTTQQDYATLSHLFNQIEPYTIEQYYIQLKIERVKELLVYDELSIKEIAYKMHYSSVSHLSKQFKKVTGHTPSYFKSLGNEKRKLIDTL